MTPDIAALCRAVSEHRGEWGFDYASAHDRCTYCGHARYYHLTKDRQPLPCSGNEYRQGVPPCNCLTFEHAPTREPIDYTRPEHAWRLLEDMKHDATIIVLAGEGTNWTAVLAWDTVATPLMIHELLLTAPSYFRTANLLAWERDINTAIVAAYVKHHGLTPSTEGRLRSYQTERVYVCKQCKRTFEFDKEEQRTIFCSAECEEKWWDDDAPQAQQEGR